MPPPHFCRRPGRCAFTLTELLVVLVILAVLAALSIPALSSVMNSVNLSSARQAIVGQLTYGRQDALANNCPVEVRFYQVADYNGNAVYRAIQTFRETTDNTGTTSIIPISKPYFLPSGMWMVYSATVSTASSLFTTGTSGAQSSTGDTTNPLPPPYGAAPYVFFRFRPNGQTDLAASSSLTIAWETAPIVANSLPANFITIHIDSVNGSVQTYQP